MPVPGRITIIRFALLVSDNLFSFPVRGCNIFVCYFEIGASPQRPRSGTRKDPNELSSTHVEVCLMGIEMELYLRKLKKGRTRNRKRGEITLHSFTKWCSRIPKQGEKAPALGGRQAEVPLQFGTGLALILNFPLKYFP